MNSKISHKHQPEAVVGSALLTAGSGPIVHSTYRALTQYTDLRGVVFSRHVSSESSWSKLKRYGGWYALQYFTSRVLESVTGNTNISGLLPSDMGVMLWESQKDTDVLIEWMRSLEIDVVFVSDIHYILTKDFLSRFRYCINIHPSLLPDYRGPHPIIWGLLGKSTEFGITLHLIDEGIDTGDIICQRAVKRPIVPLSIVVEMKLAKVLPELIKHTIEQIQEDNLHTREQEGGFYLSFPTLANRRARKQEN